MSVIPNPGMNFTPFDPLPASSLNDMVENIEALAARTALGDNIYTYTSGATWTKPADLKYIIVEVQGAGGGSGGTSGSAPGVAAASGGGGGGGYSRKKILAASLSATETVTIGAAGTAGSTGVNTGGTGGTTSFGAHVTATGGAGGAGGTNASGSNFAVGGVGGTGSSGDLNIPGKQGSPGRVAGGIIIPTGDGGDSFYGTGGTAAGSDVTGNAGNLYGGGAGGSLATTVGRAGAAGAAGLVIVHEYF